MSVRALAGLAAGDFRDRVRRPAYAVTLLAAVGLGRLAVPSADSTWVIMDVGGHRGVYNSAFVGVATALAGALWLTFAGFHVVRGGISRDAATRVGQVLAATPLRTGGYLFAKFLSNLLVLASMLGVLAGTALVMQLARGEDRAVDPVALVEPFLLLALPLMALTAAAAVLFETVPLLRGGFGATVWFAVALVIGLGGQSGSAPLGGLGVHQAARSMAEALAAQHPAAGGGGSGSGVGGGDGGGFSLGLTQVGKPLDTFVWNGFEPSGGFVLDRLLLLLLAVAVALVPALWFDRFDPARSAGPAAPEPSPTAPPAVPPTALPAVLLTAPRTAPPGEPVRAGLPRTEPRRAGAFGRLLAGEVRILARGVSRRWWLVAAALTAAGFAVPMGVLTGLLLPVLWLWPLPLWSRLGSQRAENGLEVLLAAYPAARRRLFAEWASGAVLTALLGAAPLVRMLVAGDGAGAAHWAGGVLFVPSLAVLLGVVSRTHRAFQALYPPLWYALVNNVAALDFMGAVRVGGRPAGPHPLLVAALSAGMLAVVFAVSAARRGVREARPAG
ncbi:hypothetical protein [Kitasatospora sp. NPDC057198]|uniref:hypothetical protein n=1 Tax=Kitasatospora sp. NPDC057198 TaxID=3346046 RepID=UPI00363B5248